MRENYNFIQKFLYSKIQENVFQKYFKQEEDRKFFVSSSHTKMNELYGKLLYFL